MITITVSGRLTVDPKQNTTKSGDAVVKFTLASGRGKDTDTTFVYCSVWGKRGDPIMQYVHKGDQLICTGEGSLNRYTGKDGKEYADIQVMVNSWDFGARSQKNGGQSENPTHHSAQQQTGNQIPANEIPSDFESGFDEPEGNKDIPF